MQDSSTSTRRVIVFCIICVTVLLPLSLWQSFTNSKAAYTTYNAAIGLVISFLCISGTVVCVNLLRIFKDLDSDSKTMYNVIKKVRNVDQVILTSYSTRCL